MDRDTTTSTLATDPAARPGATTVERNPDQLPILSVATAVADVTGEDPMSLPPLQEVIDGDMLDRLFAARPNGKERRSPTVVTFHYAGCRVYVYGEGRTVAVPTTNT